MPTISDYFKYATLATAAYVRTGNSPLDGATFASLARSDAQQRLPQVLAGRVFDPSAAFPGFAQ